MRSIWRDQRLGVGLLVVGIVLAVIGVLGLRSDDDDAGGASPTSTETTSTTTTAAPTSSSTTSSTTSTTTSTLDETATESPEDFLHDVLAASLRSGDIDTLVARLHPDVLAVYGEAACRDYLPGVVDPDFEFTIREVGTSGPWTYEVDGQMLEYPDALPVEVSRLANGQTVIQELHLVSIEQQWRWFTDCGEPLDAEASEG